MQLTKNKSRLQAILGNELDAVLWERSAGARVRAATTAGPMLS